MAVVAEVEIPTAYFPFHETFQSVPDASVRFLRVTILEDILTPLFWVSSHEMDAFDEHVRADSGVSNVEHLAQFEESALYRADWDTSVNELSALFAETGATVLSAVGDPDGWVLRMQFSERAQFHTFCDRIAEEDISFQLLRLNELDAAPTGFQYGLTPKQNEAMLTAWRMGYYATPRKVTLEEIATELGISQQSLSQRLQRGYNTLLRNTLAIRPSAANAE